MTKIKTYCSSCALSNFLGFLGQHSHINNPCILEPVTLFCRECGALSADILRLCEGSLSADEKAVVVGCWGCCGAAAATAVLVEVVAPLETELRGLGFNDRLVAYGDIGPYSGSEAGDKPLGEGRSP